MRVLIKKVTANQDQYQEEEVVVEQTSLFQLVTTVAKSDTIRVLAHKP